MRGGSTERPSAAKPGTAASTGDPPAPVVPPPPEARGQLLAWAEKHGVADRLDDPFLEAESVGGYHHWYWEEREDQPLTFRQALLDTGGEASRWRRYWDPAGDARARLHQMAQALAAHRRARAWLDANGRDPSSEPLAALLGRLREEKETLVAARPGPARPPATFVPTGIEVVSSPLPALRYGERSLRAGDGNGPRASVAVSLALLGWNDGPLRWAWLRGGGRPEPGHQPLTEITDVPADVREAAADAMIDFLRDPRHEQGHAELAELLQIPAWRFALGDLDRRLAGLPGGGKLAGAAWTSAAAPLAPESRIGFRLRINDHGELLIEPVVQKRQRNGTYSKGSRIEWHRLPQRDDVTELDRRVYRAHSDHFARRTQWGGVSAEPTFAMLCALIDHPAVSIEGQPPELRPDIRQGRLRLRFAAGPDGALGPQLDLLGHMLLPSEVAPSIHDHRYVIHFRRPQQPEARTVEVLLATLSREAAAVIEALATAPGRFPVEAHDALATRLESLQETMDIEFPSAWTRTIAPADGRPLVRLELLASGALSVRLAIRPVQLGPVFPPGEGPTLVLEGQGKDRHGARRDAAAERQAAHALAERLDLSSAAAAAETEPWSWRVNEGDPALHVVATLKEMGDAVVVEWADDARLFALGSINRGSMRMQVADRIDWFGVEGGAEVKVDAGKGVEVVPLATLFAAIRDGHRYVHVGARGFVRIEDTLRAALERAEAAFFDHRGSLQVSAVATDALMGLVEQQAQVKASAEFSRLRERMRAGADVTPRLSPAMTTTLRPYQHAGVRWMARLSHWGAGVILADEMGLGKTVQTLAMLGHRAQTGPALVVAPTSVTPNWLTEARRFAPELRAIPFRGAERTEIAAGTRTLGPGDVLVSSYAIATMEAEALGKLKFGTLVIDEAQSVKNATTERAKALRDLNAAWRVGLTGTPIENRLGELWSIMRVLSPGLLGSWEQFRARYAVPIEKFGDDARRKGLATLLRPFILRRTKAEVAPELPARTELLRTVRLSPEERALYDELRRSTLAEITQAKKDRDRDGGEMRIVLLAALTRLRQLCCHPRLVYPNTPAGSSKANTLLELLEDLREEQHRVLVFSQFRSFLDLLAPRLRQHGHRVLVLDGTTPSEVREQRVAAFQAGEAEVFLISLKAGGFGLNLTAADTVVHLDPWWNPAVEDQATARAHRIGQDKPVTAIRLVAQGTIEESVLGLHASKRALATGILEGTETAASLDTEELVKLIESGFEGGGNG